MMERLSANNIHTLNIKPVATYPEESGRNTTITSFDAMLQKQSASGDTVYSAEANTSANAGKTDAAEYSNTAEGVTYRDPVTGKTVRYVDVAQDQEDSSGDTDALRKTSAYTYTADSADSMKKTKYDEYFKQAAKKYDVSESLLKAIAKAESNFNAKDVSSAGAMGVMQLMPDTAKGLGVKDPFDPKQNIMGGAKCIALKLKEFKGNVRLALAAYNAGSGAVRRTGGIPSQCQVYIKRVLSYKEAFETANAVG